MRAEELIELDSEEPRQPSPASNGKATNGHFVFTLPEKLPDYWYRTPGNSWYAKDKEGVYREYTGSHIKDLLLEAGVRSTVINGERLSPLSQVLLAIRRQQVVSWSGELAGFPQGVHEVCGHKILITKGPKWIKAAKGKWPVLQKLIGELLGDQAYWFYAWIKSTLRSMYAGFPFRPGQALALAGPAGAGKSLLQSVITEMLGGRSARPYEWLMGETSFNEDLIGSEHLMIEDDASSRDPRKRAFFGAQLKKLIANEIIRGHPKGAKAMYVHAFNRVTISLNDEPENLLVLPNIADDNSDKITLLKTFRATFPFGKDNLQARRKFRDTLSSELPAFFSFLAEWKIPARMADQRYGCKAYQNEELIQALHQEEPETHLLELIDRLKIWGVDNTPWQGTATQLQDELREKDRHGRVADLLSWPTACGQYLSKLSKKVPNRVRKVKSRDNKAVWEILP